MNKKMICINQQTGVFCDSYVGNDTGILFASFWGRNTSLQQFLARMELPPHEGGINELTFEVSELSSSLPLSCIIARLVQVVKVTA
jgi:hypothetical protein